MTNGSEPSVPGHRVFDQCRLDASPKRIGINAVAKPIVRIHIFFLGVVRRFAHALPFVLAESEFATF